MFKHFLFNTKSSTLGLSSLLFKPASFNYMTLTNRAMIANRSLLPQYRSLQQQQHSMNMMFMGMQPRFTFIARAP